MPTLLLRLAAPMQSWGDESKYDVRRTLREPTKSGVVGLLAAALGLRRGQDEEIMRLSRALRMGVRVEQEGEVQTDFHTVKGFSRNTKGEIRYEKDGTPILGSSYLTYRDYLNDAVFLVGLESEDGTLLQALEQALHRPAFPLYLGRRSCPPTLPLTLGLRTGSLEETLKTEPWHAAERIVRRGLPRAGLRLILEEKPGIAARARMRDEPLSFSPLHRSYGYRALQQEQRARPGQTQHDAMSEL